MLWTVLLLSFAVVCFVLAIIMQPANPPAQPRFNLIAAGLAFWALETLIWAVHH
jgi:hypothetical protein